MRARVLVVALPLCLGGCLAEDESPPPLSPAEAVLAAAARAIGSDTATRPFHLLADASVEGPDGEFSTLVHSSSDGRMRMEQQPFGFVGGVGRDGPWLLDEAGTAVEAGPAIAFLRGHELHMLAVAPESRLAKPRHLGTASLEGESALAVALDFPEGDSVVLYFSLTDTIPAGLRITSTEPHVVVRWSGWEERDGLRLFRQAVFRQGDEGFVYHFEDVRVGTLADSTFEPPDGPALGEDHE